MSKNVVVVKVDKYSFFVTKSSNFVIHESGADFPSTRICDGVHNNGGWQVYMDTDKVVKMFADAYEQLA